ncbi:transport protein Sec23-like protein, partial [Tanacetum coccineum]
ETFFEGLLMNGWLLNLDCKCGEVEEVIAKWTFHLRGVKVYELGCGDISKVYVFQRSKEMSKEYVLDQFGIHGGVGGGGGVIIHRLEELGTNQWLILPGNRSLRCIGVALSVAVGLLAACVSGTGGRIVVLVGGPCTEVHGLGLIDLEELMVIQLPPRTVHRRSIGLRIFYACCSLVLPF